MVAKIIQKRKRPDSRTYLGSGKVDEISKLIEIKQADLVVFDSELTPSQQANLEEAFGIKVIDKTALILDIFTQRARSNEGKIQVELAQLEYLLPRLKGKGIELSRLGGGIGTRRGPGETKLEVDRRRIRRRIQQIKRELKEVSRNRKIQRSKREKAEILNISLVGYTNTGKSTLLNTLTQENFLVEDKLFATLDSTARKIVLPNKQVVVISDTVGFIQRLPYQLIASFRSTLDEVRCAQLILHIIDSSQEHKERQIKAVENVLNEIDVDLKNVKRIYNKIDKLDKSILDRYKKLEPDALFISAKKNIGIEELINFITEFSTKGLVMITASIPFSKGQLVQEIYKNGMVFSSKHDNSGTVIEAAVPRKLSNRLKKIGINILKK